MRGTRTALRPLSQVIETSSRIAAGDAELRLRPTRTDTELGSLAAAFDQMVDALERAVADAQDTEAAMRRFLADASHELRTPIAALQATAETLLREQPPRPRRDELEAALAGSASRLGRLIDDLLSLARLEGTFQPRPEPVDLAELARTAADEARLQHAGPTIELKTGTARVQGDANALLRVIRNLLDNALAAVPADGRVNVTTRRRGDQVQLVVTDDGPGIPDGDRERVFERFIRLDNIHAPGSGLGLAIARRIVRQHDGQLTCDPVPHGASFTLQLPAWER
jgi:signal transduction histidine kinase